MAEEKQQVLVHLEVTTISRADLIRAFELWRKDDDDGKCEPGDPETRPERDADSMLDYIRQAKAED